MSFRKPGHKGVFAGGTPVWLTQWQGISKDNYAGTAKIKDGYVDEPVTVSSDKLSPEQIGSATAWNINGVRLSIRVDEEGRTFTRFDVAPDSAIEFEHVSDEKMLPTRIERITFMRHDERIQFTPTSGA